MRRAAALMARGWVGDAAFALRDCDTALRLEPHNSKAMHRRVLALQELRQLRVHLCPLRLFQAFDIQAKKFLAVIMALLGIAHMAYLPGPVPPR